MLGRERGGESALLRDLAAAGPLEVRCGEGLGAAEEDTTFPSEEFFFFKIDLEAGPLTGGSHVRRD
jgi:hypothetical protein